MIYRNVKRLKKSTEERWTLYDYSGNIHYKALQNQPSIDNNFSAKNLHIRL